MDRLDRFIARATISPEQLEESRRRNRDREPGVLFTFVVLWLLIWLVGSVARLFEPGRSDWLVYGAFLATIEIIRTGVSQSFARRSWRPVAIMVPCVVLSVLFTLRYFDRIETSRLPWLATGVIAAKLLDVGIRRFLARRSQRAKG